MLGSDVGPNRVQEIKTDSLGSLPVLQRDEGMVLYGPPLTVVPDRKIQYEIVLNRPCSDNLSTAYRYILDIWLLFSFGVCNNELTNARIILRSTAYVAQPHHRKVKTNSMHFYSDYLFLCP